MMENQSIGRKESHNRDLLSDLPLSIIHIILAFLPIRDSVRTCILSTQWRYTWTTLPELDFDNECAYDEEDYDFKYDDFINCVLFRHQGPIHNFKLSCSVRINIIHEWVFFLARNGIRELTLGGNSGMLQTYSSLYSCKKLTYLDLFCCALDPPPSNFRGFLFLKCLILHTVNLSADEIQRLVSICPVLERFDLISDGDLKLRISAPNLKWFFLLGDYQNICIYAPLLAELSVELVMTYDFAPKDSSVCNFTNFFGGFTVLEKLTGSSYFTEYMSFGIGSCSGLLVFQHLKLIELNEVNFLDVKETTVVARLVIGSPNLHTLKIKIDNDSSEYESDSEAPDLCFSDLGCEFSFKLEKLRNVILSYVTGSLLELKFMKFLLKCSPVLETMSVGTSSQINTEEKLRNLRAELLGCIWASQNVKVMMNKSH